MKQTALVKWFLFSESDFFTEKNMPGRNLRNLIAEMEITESLGNLTSEIENIAFDSRKVRLGGLFVAISGEKHDG